MKTWYKIFTVFNIVILLTSIAIYVANKNIQAVSGWVVALGWYLVHIKDEAECEKLIKALKDVYEELKNAEK